MLKEVASLGFQYVELSHGIRLTLVPGILKALDEGVVKVGTCHNFCPLPAGVMHPAPNLFQPSSSDRREQDQWLRNTKRSIDFASQVGAKVLVCHLGSVWFFWFNPAKRLRHYMRTHAGTTFREDERYLSLRDKCLSRLRKHAPRYVEAVVNGIGLVLDYAKEKGVTLGFENREKFDELPLDAEFESLFSALPSEAPVGYWHDVGHADLKENMALLDHREHLERNAPRLLGFHLHDVSVRGQDHQAVGSGRIDFKMISQFWKPSHFLVLELNPRLNTAEVLSSKQRIEALLAARFPS